MDPTLTRLESCLRRITMRDAQFRVRVDQETRSVTLLVKAYVTDIRTGDRVPLFDQAVFSPGRVLLVVIADNEMLLALPQP